MAVRTIPLNDSNKLPEFWLLGTVEGDEEPLLLEIGTRQECELVRDVHLAEEHQTYAELFILGLVDYTSKISIGAGDVS
jgi:hypothetical protein